MTDVGIALMFLAAIACPFIALLVVVFGHWLTDRAWRQW